MGTDRALFVAVGGWPGSGKSTLAAALAAELSLPLLAKDEIKEALMDSLGDPSDVAGSRRLGRAAVYAMFAAARRCPDGAVLDSTWYGYAIPLAAALPGRVVPVCCVVPARLARARYQARTGTRHAGHRDADRTDAELWADPPGPAGLGVSIEVDTSQPVDVRALAAQLRAPA